MIHRIAKILALRLASESLVATIGSIIMYAGAIAFCALACREIYGLSLSAMQIIFGLLLVVCTTMLMIIGGILLSVLGHLSDLRN